MYHVILAFSFLTYPITEETKDNIRDHYFPGSVDYVTVTAKHRQSYVDVS